MANLIDRVFTGQQRLRLMTHVVAGYPDLEMSERLVVEMARSGVDLVEIQIPFTDPLADGPTIVKANQAALDNGVMPDDCFRLARRLRERVDIPLLFMTYANIPFSIGWEEFIRRSVDAGISGLIVPDLPFDEGVEFSRLCREYDCYLIPVVSPGMSDARLAGVLESVRGFVYATLRVGITGARKEIDDAGLNFLQRLKQFTTLPIAAGFGISSAGMLSPLEGRIEAAVIGSHVLNLLNTRGLEAVSQFIRSCKA